MTMSDEEYQAAQTALAAETARRRAEADAQAAAQQAAEYERRAPLRAIVAAAGFTAVAEALAAMSPDLRADDMIGPAIKAVEAGFRGLTREANAVAAPVATPIAEEQAI